MSITPQDPQKRAQGVQRMFASIAPRYDLMNRLMTGGMDVRWRVEVIRRARIGAGDHLLDLGAGTGDLAREALKQAPGARVVAADFTVEMMQTGLSRYGKPRDWSGADALHLPFPDQCFDAVVSGFLMRNVVDVPRALAEQYRVLKLGGRLVTLDTTRPRENLLSPFIRFHMRKVIPWLGGLLSGDRSAYTYLPETSENFLPAEELLARIHEAGFRQAGFRRLNFGTVAIHWAER
ncbi:MAG: ubiquinone/menaquinone biosynthesis methyltransferase [Anaerolineaceae bacterium]|nr:ubiquinone/menaquinone biosynthesis methyltransferase [Anaerolineaceae bacterium]